MALSTSEDKPQINGISGLIDPELDYLGINFDYFFEFSNQSVDNIAVFNLNPSLKDPNYDSQEWGLLLEKYDNAIYIKSIELALNTDVGLGIEFYTFNTDKGETNQELFSTTLSNSNTTFITESEYGGNWYGYKFDISEELKLDLDYFVKVTSNSETFLGVPTTDDTTLTSLWLNQISKEYNQNLEGKFSKWVGSSFISKINYKSKNIYDFSSNEPVSWSLSGGNDIDKFLINQNTGLLSFISYPDYNNPNDLNFDNNYELDIRATDEDGNSSTQALIISVKPLEINSSNDEVAAISISDISIIEGESGYVTVTRTGNTSTIQNLVVNTEDLTAISGSDYEQVNQNILFDEGDLSKVIYLNTYKDYESEFNEKFYLSITASTDDLIPAEIIKNKSTITIIDNSSNNLIPTYHLHTDINTPREGYILETTISTKNIDVGTKLYWTISGENITISDFASGKLSGSKNIGLNGDFSFSHTIADDGLIEGYETFEIKIFSDEAMKNEVIKESLIIQDSPLTEQIADIVLDLEGLKKVVSNLVRGQSYTLNYIRDYDGNLHANTGDVSDATKSAYKYQNALDVNGDGTLESIYTNMESGRWVTATINALTGKVDYSDYGKNGTTRIVGIYEDPLIVEGDKNGGFLSDGVTPAPANFDVSDADRFLEVDGETIDRLALNSQVRFQNDLKIDNLIAKKSNDFDSDGIHEVYWKTADGTAYLRALMHADGNIRYANYQSESQMSDYLTNNGLSDSITEIIS